MATRPVTLFTTTSLTAALAFVLAAFFADPLYAEPHASASIEPATVSLDSMTTLTIDVVYEQESDVRIEDPDFQGLNVVGRRQMPSYQFINGDVTRRLRMQWDLSSNRAGTFEIPIPTISLEGHRLTPPTQKVTFVEGTPSHHGSAGSTGTAGGTGNAGSAGSTGTAGENYSIDLTLLPERDPYVGEQISLRYVFRRQLMAQPVMISDATPPEFNDFWLEDFSSSSQGQSQNIRTKYGIVEQTTLHQFALFPLKAGLVQIEPMTVHYHQKSFFSRGPERELTTRGVPLTVQPLPPNPPPDFHATNVGQYKFDVFLPSVTTNVGKTVTVQLRVSGDGYIDRVALPELPPIPGLHLSNKEETIDRDRSDTHVRGTKILTYTLIPTQAGALRIPEITFHYFDPQTASYQSIPSAAKELLVGPGDLPDSMLENIKKQQAQQAIDPTVQKDQPLIEDILSQLMPPVDLSTVQAPAPPFVQSFGFQVLIYLPILGLLALLLAPRLRSGGRRTTKRIMDKKQLKGAHQQLDAANSWEEVQEVLRAFLIQLTTVTPGQVTSDDIAAPLIEQGFPRELAEAWVDLLRRLESARYSLAPSAPPPESLKISAHTLIDEVISDARTRHREQRSWVKRRIPWRMGASVVACATYAALAAVQPNPANATPPVQGAPSPGKHHTLSAVRATPHAPSDNTALSLAGHQDALQEVTRSFDEMDTGKAAKQLMQLLKEHPTNPWLLYNLATAEAMQLQLGKARLHIEQATMLAPFEHDIAAQRSIISRMIRRRSIEHSLEGETLSGDEQLFWWHVSAHLYPPLLFVIMAISAWVTFLSLVIRRRTSRATFRDASTVFLFGGAAVFLLTLSVYGLRIAIMDTVTPAVLIDETVVFREGPSTYAAQVAIPENAVPGTVVRIEQQQDPWKKVVFPNGDKGWTTAGIETIAPSGFHP